MLFFKLVAQRKDGFIASLTSITVFSCAHIKIVFYCSVSLLRREHNVPLEHWRWASIHICRDFIKNQRIVIHHINYVECIYDIFNAIFIDKNCGFL